MHPAPPLEIRWLGRRPHQETWDLQHALVAAIGAGEAPDTLLLVEHEPVITLGRRRGAAANVLDAGGLPVVETERGGDVTYHGPGQLVGYPLIALGEGERDLHAYLRRLEEVLIGVLAARGLAAGRLAGQTGVWVQDRKLASVGVAVRRWVTYHGFALNVSTDLAPFRRMNPCGLPASVMATMADLMPGPAPTVEEVARDVATAFPTEFRRTALEGGPWSIAPTPNPT